MPALRRIWFWPATGDPDRPWLGHPDLDASARSANSVCELYSEAVGAPGAHIGPPFGTAGTDRSPVIVDLADPASFGDAR
jgi:hypothetical protein